MINVSTTAPSPLNPAATKEHVSYVIHILPDFIGRKLTKEEKAEIRSLPTELAVDQYKDALIHQVIYGN